MKIKIEQTEGDAQQPLLGPGRMGQSEPDEKGQYEPGRKGHFQPGKKGQS